MIDTPTLLMMLVFLLLIGAFAGVIAGLLGVGGGIVLVPAYFYTFEHLGFGGDQLMQICLGTSLATIVVTSMRSLHGHHKRGAVDWAILKSWAIYIALGAVAGFYLASTLRSGTLQWIFAILAMIASLYMGLGKDHWRIGVKMPSGPARWGLGGALGFFSSLMGIGGGTFGVPLMSVYSVPIHRAVATAAGFGIIIALPAAVGYLTLVVDHPPPFSLGAVNGPAFLVTIAMTVLTTPWGVALAHKMDARPLKKAFAGFVFLVALNMMRKALGY